VRAVEDRVEARVRARELGLEARVHLGKLALAEQAARDAALVGDDHHAPARPVEEAHALGRAGEQAQVLRAAEEAELVDQGSVAVQEDRAPHGPLSGRRRTNTRPGASASLSWNGNRKSRIGR